MEDEFPTARNTGSVVAQGDNAGTRISPATAIFSMGWLCEWLWPPFPIRNNIIYIPPRNTSKSEASLCTVSSPAMVLAMVIAVIPSSEVDITCKIAPNAAAWRKQTVKNELWASSKETWM